MALVACGECGNQVSTEAKACPKCGAKVRKPKKPTSKLLLGVLGLLLLGTVVLGTFNKREREEAAKRESARVAALTPEQLAAEAEQRQKAMLAAEAGRKKEAEAAANRNAQLGAAGLGARALRRATKDPESFDLKSLVVKNNGTACYDFRAKNSFGATFPGQAVLTTKGTLLTQEQHGNAFVRAWNQDCTKAGGEDVTELVKRVGIE